MKDGQDKAQSEKGLVQGIIIGAIGQLSQISIRILATFGASTIWDFAYATYALIGSAATDSRPMRFMGQYYLSLAFLSCVLSIGLARTRTMAPRQRKLQVQCGVAIACGCLLLGVNIVIARIVKQLATGWQGSDSGLIHFIVMALYSFVVFGFAIAGARRYRRHPSPIVVAAKGITLCKAMMTFVFLTLTAAFTLGGGDGVVDSLVNIGARYLGGVAAVTSFVIALWTIAKNIRQLRAIKCGDLDFDDEGSDDEAA